MTKTAVVSTKVTLTRSLKLAPIVGVVLLCCLNGFLMFRPKKPTRLLLACFILTSFIGCDQATKHYATNNLKDAAPQSYFGDTVRLEYALNSGGFLSLGSTLSPNTRFYIFVGFNLFFMTALIIFLLFNWNSRLAFFVPLTYILAGGIGNLIDRTTNSGLVTDFLNLGIGPVRTGIFNVADVGVMFGAIVLFLIALKEPTDDKNPAADAV
ncbi:MAG: signal peptidase II [Mariniblastus sp.]